MQALLRFRVRSKHVWRLSVLGVGGAHLPSGVQRAMAAGGVFVTFAVGPVVLAQCNTQQQQYDFEPTALTSSTTLCHSWRALVYYDTWPACCP